MLKTLKQSTQHKLLLEKPDCHRKVNLWYLMVPIMVD